MRMKKNKDGIIQNKKSESEEDDEHLYAANPFPGISDQSISSPLSNNRNADKIK